MPDMRAMESGHVGLRAGVNEARAGYGVRAIRDHGLRSAVRGVVAGESS